MRKAILILMTLTLVLTGCAGTVPVSFESNKANSNYNFMVAESGDAAVADAFAANLAVMEGDVIPEGAEALGDAAAIGLFDVRGADAICSRSAFTKLYPASLTKVMTALVALKYSSPDTILTASSSVNITEPGAQLCGLKEGDTMTLDQALHIML
ncbi:MAG: D-alanyl-D-alanine carboxypeptidase, partial [Lachnospiraceae bacterium]|nr:D-alanyl-D-alanine carboxypeptidase [Lachnospiraceae bacterium]